MFTIKQRRAFTLVELLITLSLLVLLSFLFFWVLVPSVRLASQGSTKVDVQETAILCTERIAREIQNHSGRGGVSLFSLADGTPDQPVVVGIIPYLDVDDKGGKLWAQEVRCFYWDRSSHRVLYRTWPPGPPAALSKDPLPTGRATELTPADLLDLAVEGIPVTQNVVLFDTRWSNPDKKESVEIELRVEKAVSGKTKPESYDYTRVVYMRQ